MGCKMKVDIVEKLRKGDGNSSICYEAAVEISRLRIACAKLIDTIAERDGRIVRMAESVSRMAKGETS